MRRKKIFLAVAVLLSLAMVAAAQTFEVNQPPAQAKKGKQQKTVAPAGNPENGIGWGSSIETAREARAVDQALQKGDYRSAIASANRAARSAPNNAEL
ncbi:MAG TPA: hypothetical protein VHQ22_06970, partial [Terriglobales bacterium]|nr:hypothetical protein [Terriglobales bacterium]